MKDSKTSKNKLSPASRKTHLFIRQFAKFPGTQYSSVDTRTRIVERTAINNFKCFTFTVFSTATKTQ